jgi:hypothetical protein
MTHLRKQERQDEAKVRQEQRDTRTVSEQLKLIKTRRGESEKERKRLEKKLEKEQ